VGTATTVGHLLEHWAIESKGHAVNERTSALSEDGWRSFKGYSRFAESYDDGSSNP